MKLLIVTQVVDIKHPILGFFHRWIAEFAKHTEQIHVIALQVGEYDLPKNVTVHSLGKEKGLGRLRCTINFYSLIFRLQKQYDSVFVHMNPEYIVLAGWFWRFVGKRIGLWYNHTIGSFWLRAAQPFTYVVFHTSPYAFTARYKNAKRMPAGIDTAVFKPQHNLEKVQKSVYFQGRIAPAKKVHILLEAFAEMYAEGHVSVLTLVGPEDYQYIAPLRKKYKNLIESGVIIFKGPISNSVTPKLYATHSVSVNLTDVGNYDKTVLESMACGTPVIVASEAFADAPVTRLQEASVVGLKNSFLNLRHPATQDLVEYVEKNHSLDMLGYKIYKIYERN